MYIRPKSTDVSHLFLDKHVNDAINILGTIYHYYWCKINGGPLLCQFIIWLVSTVYCSFSASFGLSSFWRRLTFQGVIYLQGLYNSIYLLIEWFYKRAELCENKQYDIWPAYLSSRIWGYTSAKHSKKQSGIFKQFTVEGYTSYEPFHEKINIMASA